MANEDVYIPSLEAKDLIIHENYTLYDSNNDFNLKRFINTLDYSLDLIKLQEVYKKVYHNRKFSVRIKGKNYSCRVINITFKYSLKEWNLICKDKDGIPHYRHYQTGEIIDHDPEKNQTIMTTAELREHLYKEGFMCDGIHYVRFKRSSGSSRVGKCLFIDDLLYPGMHKCELCGLKVNYGDKIDLAAFEAYIALTLSSIIGTLEIDPASILLVSDQESIFKETVASTYMIEDDGKYSLKTTVENCEISNSLFDGESLLDSSKFFEYFGEETPRGCLLLRNNFFKSCCFNTNIQRFFEDNHIISVKQLNGQTLATRVSQIKMITTPSSIKYLKFGTFEQWLKNISSTFGVVKYDKPTHFFGGRMVQTHYQLLNTLQMSKEDVDEFITPSLDYINLIRNNPAALKYKISYANTDDPTLVNRDGDVIAQNEMVFQLMNLNNDFYKTKIYKTFAHNLIKSMKNTIKNGHILVEGNYSTLLGNPLEYLKHSIGKYDGTTSLQPGEIMSIRFKDGERLLGSRSPHVTVGNVLLCTNKHDKEIARYFNLTNEVVCINAINDNILQQLSGADYDSDTMLITNNPVLVRTAEKNYGKFPIPTCNVEATKRVRYFTTEQKADLDIKTSNNKIGEIVNLSQDLNSLLWDTYNKTGEIDMELYCDISQLDVMSGLEIDHTVSAYGDMRTN